MKQYLEYIIIKNSGFFDSAYYYNQYPDVRQADINPLWHYIKYGWREGRNPSNLFNSNFYLQNYPDVAQSNVNPLFHYARWGKKEGRVTNITGVDNIQLGEASYLKISNLNNPALQPLNCFYSPHSKRRINLITDSINSGSLFGGVATSMILATLISDKWNCDIRIITRNESAQKQNFQKVLRANNIKEPENAEFVFVNCMDNNSELSVGDDEYYLTTSWWTTHSIIQSVDNSRVLYLIQEDERKFYPFGDELFLCSQLLHDNNIKFIVNSQLLYNYFLSEGFENFKNQGIWFEPSFPKSIFYYDTDIKREKKNFFFYARPSNTRNLFYLGVRVINKALETGILDPDNWTINFVGKDMKSMSFFDTIIPNVYQNLPWDEYANIVRKMDLGLSLMFTPHPSYPPLDLAASGAIAVTNRYGNKQNLDVYSKNILCCDLNEDALLEGIKYGVALSSNLDQRLKNYNENSISSDWTGSFKNVLNSLE